MALSSPLYPFFIIGFDGKSLSGSSNSRSAAGRGRAHVCSWWCCLIFSIFTFSAASEASSVLLTRTTTTNIVAPPPTSTPRIKTTTPLPLFTISPTPFSSGFEQSVNRPNKRLILILSLSAVVALISIMGFFTFLVRRKRRSKRVEDAELPTTPPPNSSDPSMFSLVKKNKVNDAPSLPHDTFIRRFSWEEIVKMSLNFSTVIDQGGFSMVYLAYFSDSSRGALKIHPKTDRLDRIFKQELQVLLHLRHPNIVQLLGYSDEQGDEMGGALVFEYVPNGNLQEKLHGNGKGLVSWKSRMWIAFQVARAIEYLHDKCNLPIVHGDIKAANVLLDDQLNCKLCDFGSATRGFSAMVHPSSSRSLVGSPGYTDPHYMRTGIASKKNDVYSFGVIILELITGIEAFCPVKEQVLTTIAGPLLRGNQMDPRPFMVWTKSEEDLSHLDSEEVMVMASLSAMCLNQQPSLRPSMADILATMTNEISSIASFLAHDNHYYDSMCD